MATSSAGCFNLALRWWPHGGRTRVIPVRGDLNRLYAYRGEAMSLWKREATIGNEYLERNFFTSDTALATDQNRTIRRADLIVYTGIVVLKN